MQLKKQHIKATPTFDKVSAPTGVKRRAGDYAQMGNLHPHNANPPQIRPLPMTPHERNVLEAARGARTREGVAMYEGALDGQLPTRKQYNQMVMNGHVTSEKLPKAIGCNW